MVRLLLTLSLTILCLSPVTAQRSANVVFIGNSITYGALHKEPGLTAPPAQCTRWLSAQEGIDTVYFRNCGKSGRTTYHFLPRAEDVVPAGDKSQFGDVVAKTRSLVNEHPGLPLLFSIMLGTNDTVERPRNRHTSPEDYADNLCAIIDTLLRLWPEAHVVLNKPIWYTPDYVTKNGSVASKKSLKLLRKYEKQFPKVVRRCKAGQVHIGDSEAYKYFKRHWQTDVNEEKDARGHSYWLHPNEQGARKLAEFWGKAILPTLNAQLSVLNPQPSVAEWFWPVTDKSLTKSLNGEWRLKVVKGVGDEKAVPQADSTWGTIAVPGCWEQYGYCEPKYNYPDSLTGYYRTAFTVPAEWKGQQVVIRLDGVLRGYDLWLNGHYVGTWESAYNTCLFDLTPHLTEKAFRGEPQQLAMRVYSHFKGYEFDCFDDWATMGIFRDVTLFTVPKTHLADLTVVTKANGEVTVKAEVANATPKTTTDYEIVDAQGKVVSTGGKVENPHLWTAETPYLYTLKVHVREKGVTLQSFTHKIGIREISIDGNVLKLNGRPIKLRGVNAHSTDPQTVKVVSDDLTLKDMQLMKEASVNYMRLSHYPREPRFFELADSLGFYLVDEVPFGFGDKHLSSRSYQDILKTRALATVQRDKLHPSVIVWSVGNENPLPQTCVEVGDYVGQLDPSRPYCFPQVGSYFRKFFEGENAKGFPSEAPVYAPHYPTTGQIGGFYQTLDRPVIFTEYCHTLGISFEDHDRQWDIIERTPGIAGGSVWEWADQGMPFTRHGGGGKWRTDGSERDQRVFTSMDSGFEMKGNFGTDGLLYADRTPLPNYYELQRNYARAFVEMKGGKLIFHNRYDFLNLKDNVTFNWFITSDRDTIARGAFSPECPARTTTDGCPVPVAGDSKSPALTILHFDIADAQGLTFLRQSFVLDKPDLTDIGCGESREQVPAPMIHVQHGPLVRTGRKATMAERITQKGRLPQRYLLPLENDQVKADVQREALADGGLRLAFILTPDTADVFRSELGLAWLLDKRIDRVQWIGQGPFASYPGRHQACRYGLWAKHKDDLYFEGNHGGVDAALLTDSLGNGILVVGDSLDLNFEQTDRGLVLTVNAAVSGQGPKFAKTAFNAWKPGDDPMSAECRLYALKAGAWPQAVSRLFDHPANTPAPFTPFLTQYDTYLLRFADIYGGQ